ncbi:baseplate J/gp47 family protein [Paenibacillus tuaregi]|uniref:baseplate J/gp47 family protein n=1 Tax=Paenibacillus tuaregi TaxID=1816681 RepID=UPI000A9356AC|nr:baseplate J/gp47 family protein [Paenibacillus tuaregi]
MYEKETKDVILDRMLAQIPDDIDKRQGAITYDLLSPAAIEMAHAYIELDNVLRFGFASPQQPSEYLERRAAELGLTRRPSVKAQGTLEFSGDDNIVIPAGTAVSTDEEQAVLFVTTKAGTMKSGKLQVPAEAVLGGSRGNVAARQIKLVLGNLSGIVEVTNKEAFVNGADLESDESLLGRYLDRVRRPATSGNVWHYRQWALEVPGVGDVRVFPVWKGNGTVKLALLSDDKRAPIPDIVEKVRVAVEERRPVGAKVTVSPAEEVKIEVAASLTLLSGASLEEVKIRFAKELTEYLADLAFRESIIRHKRVLGLLLNIESVIDFDSLTLNGVEGNLQIEDDHVAVPGAVKFIVT